MSSVLAFRDDDRPFDKEPTRSFSIPARYYTDPAMLPIEYEKVFHANWWLACHVSRLSRTGDYVVVDIGDEQVLIVRGRDDVIRAFYNVCQHRGHQIVKDKAGRMSNLMVCPYHAWSFALDGSLVRARNTEDMPNFDKKDYGLKSVRCESRGGFVWVNVDGNAPDIAEVVEDLEDQIKAYIPALDDLVFAERVEYRVNCNWKVLIDNFLECYHCTPAHPALVDLMDMDSYDVKTRRWMSSHIAGAPCSTETAAFNFEKGDVDFGYAAWFVWPNVTIWAYPGEANIMTLQIIPDGPDHAIEYLDVYCLQEEPSQQMKDAIKYMDEVLQPEDIGLCESVYKGLKSNGFNQGRFVCDPAAGNIAEHGVHHFQNLLMEAVSD